MQSEPDTTLIKSNHLPKKEEIDNIMPKMAAFCSLQRPTHSVPDFHEVRHHSVACEKQISAFSALEFAHAAKSLFSLRPTRDSVRLSNNKNRLVIVDEKTSLEPLNPSKRPISIISLKQRRIELSKEQIPTEHVEVKPPPLDFLEYLKLSQRHDSINFIYNLNPADILQAPRIKFIGPFLVGEKIGKGSFGKVKEGLCSETLERVAVKIIGKLRAKKTQQGVEGVVREILLLKKLNHPNVISLLKIYAKVEDAESESCCVPWFQAIEEEPVIWQYDDGTEHEKPVELLKWYLVFQFCPCTLQNILEKSDEKRLPLEESQRYFVQLMDGVDYLHSLDRDIKPGNLLLTTDGTLKISDFGVSQEFNIYEKGILFTDVFAGTHQFLAPEVLDSSQLFDGAKVDVWACGVTLYNMISGVLPFDSEVEGNYLELYDRIMKSDIVMPKEITPEIEDLLKIMFIKNPTNRASVSNVLNHPWVLKSFHRPLKLPLLLLHRQDIDPTIMQSLSELSPVCETTMIPYLNELFGKELEENLAKKGALKKVSVSSLADLADSSSPHSPAAKPRLINWIKKKIGT